MGEITFRPVEDDDLEFLARLYATTREYEMARVPWPEEQKAAFLRQQFQAQHDFYQEQFAEAEFSVVLLDGEPAGRLYVDRRADEIRLIDIALLPENRGQGIGGALMEDLLEEGREAGLPVRIHVEKNNPAYRLYDRLGFQKIEDQGVYDLLEWRPR